MSFAISGKTAIVTGSASGIGRAVALQFLEAGANVMCADASEEALQDQFGDKLEDGNLRVFAGDLREKLTIANLISATLDAFEEIDILVNGSRDFTTTDPMDPSDGSTQLLLDRNMSTALRLSQHVAKRMILQAEGREETGCVGTIVNLSSIVACHTRAELLGYSVAAAAVNQMTRSLAQALAPERVRVNAVALGSVMSASLQGALKDNKDWRQEIEAITPLGRIGSPGELTDVVQFLASDASSFITGQVLTVDGGRSLVDPVTVLAH